MKPTAAMPRLKMTRHCCWSKHSVALRSSRLVLNQHNITGSSAAGNGEMFTVA